MSEVLIESKPEVTREVTTADVLERAADLLEEFGWCQWLYAKSGKSTSDRLSEIDSFCAAGAVGRAIYDLGLSCHKNTRDPNPHDLGSEGMDFLWYHSETWKTLGGSMWNDARGRTKGEVVSMLREAARKAREQG